MWRCGEFAPAAVLHLHNISNSVDLGSTTVYAIKQVMDNGGQYLPFGSSIDKISRLPSADRRTLSNNGQMGESISMVKIGTSDISGNLPSLIEMVDVMQTEEEGGKITVPMRGKDRLYGMIFPPSRERPASAAMLAAAPLLVPSKAGAYIHKGIKT